MLLIFTTFLWLVLRDATAEWLQSNYSATELYESYPGYGKTWMYFPDGNGVPHVVLLRHTGLPKTSVSPDEIVTFHLYTRQNTNESQILDVGNVTKLHQSNMDLKKETKFITHGWRSSEQSETCQSIKNNFLATTDCNVIIIDWKEAASSLIYILPMLETKNVGEFYGTFINFLVENGAKLEQMHLIGHSLGAHVSGYAGANVQYGKVKRITGLDPALPGFEMIAVAQHTLTSSDAMFVDVIHTCAGVLGHYTPLGHADFYPNGGTPSQPGCFGLAQIIEACSHSRAWQYFAESILEPKGFPAKSCTSWSKYKDGECIDNQKAFMGEETSTTAQGVYYLETRESAPFSLSTTLL